MEKVSNKPVVHFINEPSFFDYYTLEPNNGEPTVSTVAMVQALDHHVWGQDKVRTSVVVKKNDDGSFETLNTLYKPSNVN